MDQAVSLRFLTAEPRVRAQVSPCETYGATGSGLLFPPVNTIPPTFHTHFHLHVTLIRRTDGLSLGT